MDLPKVGCPLTSYRQRGPWPTVTEEVGALYGEPSLEGAPVCLRSGEQDSSEVLSQVIGAAQAAVLSDLID